MKTAVPHKLIPGDYVKIENSRFEEINGVHLVSQAGIVEPAEGTVQINAGGAVIGVTLTSPGKYYASDFYVYFSGGGGVGAYGYATVDPLVLGGGISNIEIVEGGVLYTTAPDPIFGNQLPNNVFQIYTYQGIYGDDNDDVIYSASGAACENTASYIDVSSGGIGYSALPIAKGIVKRTGDRAKTKITLSGSGIASK